MARAANPRPRLEAGQTRKGLVDMTTMRESTSHRSSAAAWSAGGVIFAATLMIIGGVFGIFEGIAGLVNNNLYVRPGVYAWRFTLYSWGWVHLFVGIALVCAGLALFSGSNWARYFGIFAAGVSLLTQFFFVPYYPLWSLAIMAMDVFIIWALATAPRHGAFGNRDTMREQQMAESRMGGSRMDTPPRDM